MTGQVKEDIIARFGELGIRLDDGCVHINPELLRKSEFLTSASTFEYYDIHGDSKTLEVKEGSLAFTLCQVPIVYNLSDTTNISVQYKDGTTMNSGIALSKEMSQEIFVRSGKISSLVVDINTQDLIG